jgi:hypothetical protein
MLISVAELIAFTMDAHLPDIADKVVGYPDSNRLFFKIETLQRSKLEWSWGLGHGNLDEHLSSFGESGSEQAAPTLLTFCSQSTPSIYLRMTLS